MNRIKKLFNILAKNTKPDKDQWIWMDGDFYRKSDVEKWKKLFPPQKISKKL